MRSESELLKIAKNYVMVNITYPSSYAYIKSKEHTDSIPEANKEEKRYIRGWVLRLFDLNSVYKGIDSLYKMEVQKEKLYKR